MKHSLRSRSNSKSLSKLDEEIDKLIEEEINNKNKLSSIKNILEEDEELTDQIPEDLGKKVLEIAEDRELDMANSKKNKQRKKSIDILNENIDDLYQKTINESKAETKGTDSLSKNSKLGKKRKRLSKRRKDSDEDYENSLEEENKSVNSFMNDDSNYEKDNYYDNSSYCADEKELMDFVNKKTCQTKSLLKYKEIYNKKRNHLIILEDEDDVNNQRDINIPLKEEKSPEKEKKVFKRLKKNTDNKELQLPLDTECIICTCIITDLANPDGCNHNFCKSCLIEWSLRSSKCPMCKKYYQNIFTYEKGEKRKIPLYQLRTKYKNVIKDSESEINQESQNPEEIDDLSEVGCYICGRNNEPEKMLICDRCHANCCHYYCSNLKRIPEGKWYCSLCLKEIKEIKLQKKKVGQFFL